MRLSELPGAAYLFFFVCVCILGFGYLLLAWLFAFVQIAVFFLQLMSKGIGYG